MDQEDSQTRLRIAKFSSGLIRIRLYGVKGEQSYTETQRIEFNVYDFPEVVYCVLNEAHAKVFTVRYGHDCIVLDGYLILSVGDMEITLPPSCAMSDNLTAVLLDDSQCVIKSFK